MDRFLKIIIKLFFCIWIITQVLPELAIRNYEIIHFLFQFGTYLSIVVGILALITFTIPLMSRKKIITASGERKKLILHDLDNETAEKVFQGILNTDFYCALKKTAACNGCLGCWLQTPGSCIMHDGTESFGKQIACCDEFIIISKNLYGGFSKEIKTVLDRSISFVLPFFAVRNRELHHQMRYTSNGIMKVYIYNSNKVSDEDKTTLMEITKANSINMNKSNYETIFVNDMYELKEILI